MKKTAIVCVTNDLSTDQRVHKTCLTLEKCGYWVVEYGRLLPESKPLQRNYFILRKKLFFHSGPLFYAEYNIRLFFHLLIANVDLIFANDLDTLPAAFLAATLRGKRLIYDTHEFYTETPELVSRPTIQAIWKKIENTIYLNPGSPALPKNAPKTPTVATIDEVAIKIFNIVTGEIVNSFNFNY